MSHPITAHRRSLFLYSGVWLGVMILFGLLLYYFRDISLLLAFTDAFFTIAVFGLLGLLIWYPTRYIPFQKQNPIYSVSAHAVVGILVIFTWLLVSLGILGLIFNSDTDYQGFLTHSIFYRAIVGIMIYLVLLLVYYLAISARNLQERVLAEERLKTLVKESELNMLKAQINPHFLFNSLNSVSSLIIKSPEEAQEMILRLSDFIRYSLKHRENEYVALNEEIRRMEDYLAIEKVRFGDRLVYLVDASDACGQIEVPTMILQPLIENAIKHGVYESIEPVEISFRCRLSDGFLLIEIVNDFDPDQPSQRGTGVGLRNVSERMRLAYDDRGSFRWRTEGRKFKAILNIPSQKKLK